MTKKDLIDILNKMNDSELKLLYGITTSIYLEYNKSPINISREKLISILSKDLLEIVKNRNIKDKNELIDIMLNNYKKLILYSIIGVIVGILIAVVLVTITS